MEPAEIIIVDTDTVYCDGGDAALGHPRVYLNLGDDGRVDCPYCDRQFVRAGTQAQAELEPADAEAEPASTATATRRPTAA